MMKSTIYGLTWVIFSASAFAENRNSAGTAYCAELQQIVSLASQKDQLLPIAGPWREGNFRHTSLPLSGWGECSLYGTGTYTCDSRPTASAEEAERAQARIVDEILSCFAGQWLHIVHRSSSGYAVLHPIKGTASITLSVDETDAKQLVVRLTLFVRRG